MQNAQQQNPVQAGGPPAVPPVVISPPPLQQWQQDANNLNLDAEERELHRILCHTHNFTRSQYTTLREEGYGTIHELRNWKHKEINTLLTNLSNRPINRGGQRYGDRRIKQLQALAWFVNNSYARGLPVDLVLYEADPDRYILNAA